MICPRTIYQLEWGGGADGGGKRFFEPHEYCDAVTRFADRVTELDRDDAVHAAFACLRRLPDSIIPQGQDLVSWTKTSDECPTVEGAQSLAELGLDES